MRPQNKSRSRNKQGNNGGQHNNNGQRRNTMGNIINRVFESAGPDGKVRGTPQQIIDKYQALARDAQLSGDRVACESYLQHSEHYSRLLGEAQRAQQETRFAQERDERGGEEGGFDPQQQRRQQPMAQPVASGLAMIDPEDVDDFSGPIETPESRRQEFVPVNGERRQDRQERFERRRDRESQAADAGQERQPAFAPVPAPEPQPVAAEVPAPVRAEPVPAPEPAPVVEAAPEPAPVVEAAPAPEVAPEPVAEAAPPKRRRRPRVTAPVETAPEAPAAPAEAE